MRYPGRQSMMKLLSPAVLVLAAPFAGAQESVEVPINCAMPIAAVSAIEDAACCAVPKSTQTVATTDSLDMPWTGAALRNPLLEFNAAAAKNCTAGACSVGDGYKVNYNAISMNVCCSSCAKKFGDAPAKHIRNIWKDVDAALSVEPSSTT